MSKLGLMYQGQLIVIMKYALNLLINESLANLNFLVGALNEVLEHFSVSLLFGFRFLVYFLIFA